MHGNQHFTLVFIRANSKRDVPGRRRQLIRRAVKINRTAMTIALAQTKKQMLFIHHARGRDRLDFTRKEQRLRIPVSKWLQHLVPAQKIDVDLGERQLVVESQTRLQRFLREEYACGAATCLQKTIEFLV